MGFNNNVKMAKEKEETKALKRQIKILNVRLEKSKEKSRKKQKLIEKLLKYKEAYNQLFITFKKYKQ